MFDLNMYVETPLKYIYIHVLKFSKKRECSGRVYRIPLRILEGVHSAEDREGIKKCSRSRIPAHSRTRIRILVLSVGWPRTARIYRAVVALCAYACNDRRTGRMRTVCVRV